MVLNRIFILILIIGIVSTQEDYEEESGHRNLDSSDCGGRPCFPGNECVANEDGEPQCVCMKSCPPRTEETRKVCSNHNETWDDECELHRMRCFCIADQEECRDPNYKNLYIDYFGACKAMEPCSPGELEDFPRRLRDWLFVVMKVFAEQNELSAVPLAVEEEEEEEEGELSNSRKWVNAVMWKFCDLDVHRGDRQISRHELFPLRAPLVAMEHCLEPFLDKCDADSDGYITLAEWGTCLGLEENEMDDKCTSMLKKDEEEA